jgi:hypothetical protein
MGDQIEALTIQLSNMGGYNWDESGDPSAEHGTHGHQHRV